MHLLGFISLWFDAIDLPASMTGHHLWHPQVISQAQVCPQAMYLYVRMVIGNIQYHLTYIGREGTNGAIDNQQQCTQVLCLSFPSHSDEF